MRRELLNSHIWLKLWYVAKFEQWDIIETSKTTLMFSLRDKSECKESICSFETPEWEKPHLRPHLWFFPIGLNVKMLLSKTSLMLMNFDLANSRALTQQFPLNAPQTAHQLVNRCDMHWMWLLWKLLSIHNLILLEAWNQYSSHSFAVSNFKALCEVKRHAQLAWSSSLNASYS